MKTVAIVQARMGSTRLPGKVLSDIAGTPMLFRIIDRARAARTVDALAVATTTAPEDDRLAERLTAEGIDVYRGSVGDVLERYYECARRCQADLIVRVTADDPLKDPQLIDRAVSFLLHDPAHDYSSNTIEPTYPEGLDIEAFRFPALARAHGEARLASDREHVTPYIWRQPDRFKVRNFTSDRDLSAWRWTVDKPQDLELMRRIFAHFQDAPLVRYQDVITWLDAHPEIALINAGTIRNEAYLNDIRSES